MAVGLVVSAILVSFSMGVAVGFLAGGRKRTLSTPLMESVRGNRSPAATVHDAYFGNEKPYQPTWVEEDGRHIEF